MKLKEGRSGVTQRLKDSQGATLTYGAENRLTGISGSTELAEVGAATASFAYDGRACPERSRRGNRSKSVLNGETTTYVGSLYEKKVVGSATTHTKYYTFGGRRLALRVAGTLSWLLSDHLGSTAVTADGATGVRAGELWYKPLRQAQGRLRQAQGRLRQAQGGPWGESRGVPFGATPTARLRLRRACGVNAQSSRSPKSQRRFTGQTLDSVAGGLYFYNARYYDPALGRFAQADTIVPQPGNPQSLNR